jgi:hypothetical protein
MDHFSWQQAKSELLATRAERAVLALRVAADQVIEYRVLNGRGRYCDRCRGYSSIATKS